MFKYLKLIPKLLTMRSIKKEYEDLTGEKRPWYFSRRFRGAVIATVLSAISIYGGVEVGENMVSSITEHTETIITSAGVLWGLAQIIVGQIKKDGG